MNHDSIMITNISTARGGRDLLHDVLRALRRAARRRRPPAAAVGVRPWPGPPSLYDPILYHRMLSTVLYHDLLYYAITCYILLSIEFPRPFRVGSVREVGVPRAENFGGFPLYGGGNPPLRMKNRLGSDPLEIPVLAARIGRTALLGVDVRELGRPRHACTPCGGEVLDFMF